MAGKAGSAAEAMRRVALVAALRLEREAQVLAEAPPSKDGTEVEKLARQLKAVTDAGRSAVALEAACAKATVLGAPSPADPADPGSGDEEMDMDDEPPALRSPAKVLQLRAELERQLDRVLGPCDQKSDDRRPGAGRSGRHPGPLAVHLPGGAASA